MLVCQRYPRFVASLDHPQRCPDLTLALRITRSEPRAQSAANPIRSFQRAQVAGMRGTIGCVSSDFVSNARGRGVGLLRLLLLRLFVRRRAELICGTLPPRTTMGR